MKQGYLSQYFVSVAAKRLSAVEADPERSNQHEFNGSKELKRVLGTGTGEPISFQTRFIWFGGENEGIVSDGSVTWYDARLAHPKRSEYRLYFPTNEVMSLARERDTIFIAKRTDDTLLLIVTSSGTTLENQLHWLFGISKQIGFDYSLQEFEKEDVEVDFTVRFILDELGIDIEEPDTDFLDSLLEDFKRSFPLTKDFSKFARDNVRTAVNAIEEPDNTLMEWLDFEELLFRRLERHIVAERLEKGFSGQDGADVDGFISFSLSVQNRRKSRAGHSLEHHLEEIFKINKLRYERGAKTENNSSPDFLFPGVKEYHNLEFPVDELVMLGVKTSCKDRWRQVLSEARRIPRKHLLTLEPSISVNQTQEMQSHNLQLVLPAQIHETYFEEQRTWLMNLSDFICFLSKKGAIGG